MKHLKHIIAAALTVLVAFAMATPALAATGDITVNGAIKDAKYEAYKVFDVTYDADDNNKVNYTIPEGSKIADVKDFDTVFTTVDNGGKVYVMKKDGVEDSAVIDWLKDNETAVIAASTKKAEATASTANVTLATGEAGYYFIKSTSGDKSAVTIDTAHPEATVNSKIPSTPIVPEGAKKINGKAVNTMEIGEQATFTVELTATNYSTDDKGNATAINSYTMTDTADGFTIDPATVEVTVNGAAYAIAGKSIDAKLAGNVLTVTIPWDQTTYTAPSTVVVTYKGTLTDQHAAAESSNKVNFKYNDTPIPGEPKVYTYNYTIDITKVDKDNKETKLEGAKFVLKKGDEFYKYDETKKAVEWVANQNDATPVTTDDNGKAEFKGLKAGTYTLVETEAPAGYNMAANTTITLDEVTEKLTEYTILTNEVTVEDAKGGVLPSTGGMGTTLFYVVGGLMVAGAAIALIAKNRVAKMEA